MTTRRPLRTRWTALMAVALAATAAGIRTNAADAADFTGFKGAPGLRCPCPLSVVPHLPRGLVHTIVLSGTGLRGATTVLAGTGITGNILSATNEELSVTLNVRADVPQTARRVAILAGTTTLGAFTIQPVSLGRIDDVEPAEIPGGARTIVAVTGRDILTAAFDGGNTAARTVVSRAADRVTLALAPGAADTRMAIALGEQLPSGFRRWRQVEIAVKPAPPPPTCRPLPYEAAIPTLLGPADGLVYKSTSGEPLTTYAVTFRWQPAETSGADPLHRLEIETSYGLVSREIRLLSYPLVLPAGKFRWTMRSMNCGGSPGKPAPSRTFEIR